MHPYAFGFFPGLFWGGFLFFGLLRLLFFVLLIVLVVRLVSHAGRRHAWHHHAYATGWGHDAATADPRRIAAWRYAAGKIDRPEFDRIVAALDASEPRAGGSDPAAGAK
jgi:uncharacterized membrane protein